MCRRTRLLASDRDNTTSKAAHVQTVYTAQSIPTAGNQPPCATKHTAQVKLQKERRTSKLATHACMHACHTYMHAKIPGRAQWAGKAANTDRYNSNANVYGKRHERVVE